MVYTSLEPVPVDCTINLPVSDQAWQPLRVVTMMRFSLLGVAYPNTLVAMNCE